MPQQEFPKQSAKKQRKFSVKSEISSDFVNRISDALIEIDKNGRFAYVNEETLQILRRETAEELIGQEVWAELPDSVSGALRRACQQAMQTQEADQLEVYFESSQRWYVIHIYPSADGLSLYFRDATQRKQTQSTLHKAKEDINELKQAQAALKASEERYRTVVENASDGIFVSDPLGYYIDVNSAGARALGYEPEELIGKHLSELVAPDNLAETPLKLADLKAGKSLIAERKLMRKDGSIIFAEISSRMLPNGNFLGILRDITERKQTQEAMERYNQRLTILHEIDKYIIQAYSTEMIVEKVLFAIRRLFSCERASITLFAENTDEALVLATSFENETIIRKIVGMSYQTDPWLEELKLSGQVWQVGDITQIDTATHGFVQSMIDKDFLSYLIGPIMLQGELTGILNLAAKALNFFTPEQVEIIQQITYQLAISLNQSRLREQIEQANIELEQRVEERTAKLQISEARYRAIVDDQTDMVCRYLPGGFLTFVNESYCQLFDKTTEELLGKSLFDLIPQTGRAKLERHIATLSRDMPFNSIEVPHITFDGQVRWLHWNDRMLFDEDGQFVEYQAVGRDITERKLVEQQLENMLEHAMKLNELRSRYIAMAAHDLRNPLAIIKTSLGLVEHYSDRLTPESRQAKYDQVNKSINIMVRMLDDVLTIGKIEAGKIKFEPALVNIVVFCEDIVREVKEFTGTSQQIRFSRQGDCGKVHLDINLLRHILTNLLSNAIKYSFDDSVVTFELACNADHIRFRIQDFGIGIPKADQIRLFEAFHRAKNTKGIPGTGLGLSIVKQSVELHGGKITFESQENVGTTFVVTLNRHPLDT